MKIFPLQLNAIFPLNKSLASSLADTRTIYISFSYMDISLDIIPAYTSFYISVEDIFWKTSLRF